MTKSVTSNEPDEGQQRILDATDELLNVVKERGGHLNFGDCFCKFCHKKIGSCESNDGLPWDIKFVCDNVVCKIKQVEELEAK